jgi:signal transduction histidine kinase
MNKSVGTIEIAVDKAARVVKALNNFSHGNLEQELVDFQLRDSIDSVVTILWNKIKTGASVKLDVELNVLIFGNQEELAQVWTNLMNNALQASNNKCNILIRHWLVGGWHHIRFSNDGPPIPQEVLPKIFDAFFTTKKQGEGTGLGLNISKQIIEKHGGQIKVDSREGDTSFDIILPVKRTT